MANTPQAKKRIRRNDRRAEINGARVSRIRTFVKKVELALTAGDKDAAAAALGAGAAGDVPWRVQGRGPQEHRLAQVRAADQAGRRARLTSPSASRLKSGARRSDPAGVLRVASRDSHAKADGFPAIRADACRRCRLIISR